MQRRATRRDQFARRATKTVLAVYITFVVSLLVYNLVFDADPLPGLLLTVTLPGGYVANILTLLLGAIWEPLALVGCFLGYLGAAVLNARLVWGAGRLVCHTRIWARVAETA